jgi:hypothetical protein
MFAFSARLAKHFKAFAEFPIQLPFEPRISLWVYAQMEHNYQIQSSPVIPPVWTTVTNYTRRFRKIRHRQSRCDIIEYFSVSTTNEMIGLLVKRNYKRPAKRAEIPVRIEKELDTVRRLLDVLTHECITIAAG